MKLSDRTQKARRNLFIATFVAIAVGCFDAKLRETIPYLVLTLPSEFNVLAIAMLLVLGFLTFDYWVRMREDEDNAIDAEHEKAHQENMRIYELEYQFDSIEREKRIGAIKKLERMEAATKDESKRQSELLKKLPIQRKFKDKYFPFSFVLAGFCALFWRICN